jgi:8-oxo-dGTP diphosphatase
MTGVAAAVIVKDNKVLIARRGEGQRLSGFWEFPGGKIEKDETAPQAIVREIQEELGMIVKVNSFLGECVHHYGTWSIKLIVHVCEWVSGEAELTVHDDVAWVSASELDDYYLAEADLHFTDAVRELLENSVN